MSHGVQSYTGYRVPSSLIVHDQLSATLWCAGLQSCDRTRVKDCQFRTVSDCRRFLRSSRVVLLRGDRVRSEDGFDGGVCLHRPSHRLTSGDGMHICLLKPSGFRIHAAPYGPNKFVVVPPGESCALGQSSGGASVLVHIIKCHAYIHYLRHCQCQPSSMCCLCIARYAYAACWQHGRGSSRENLHYRMRN